MSDLDPSALDPLVPVPPREDRALEELARQRIAADDDQLQRNLDELERLASLDEEP